MTTSQVNGASFVDPNSGVHYPMAVLITYENGKQERIMVNSEADLWYLGSTGLRNITPLTRTARASSPHLKVQ